MQFPTETRDLKFRFVYLFYNEEVTFQTNIFSLLSLPVYTLTNLGCDAQCIQTALQL